jgi:hypothetical protein
MRLSTLAAFEMTAVVCSNKVFVLSRPPWLSNRATIQPPNCALSSSTGGIELWLYPQQSTPSETAMQSVDCPSLGILGQQAA